MTSYAQTLKMADRFGSKLVGFQNTNVYDKLNGLTLRLEDQGGGVNATPAQNDAAFLALFAIADLGSRGTIQLQEGLYQISQPVRSATFDRALTITGFGQGRTTLQQTNPNLNCIELPTGLNSAVLIEKMTLQGAGTGTSYSGTGKGIYQAPTIGNDSFNIKFRDLYLTNFGGDCINLGNSFTVDMYAVGCNFSGGNGITGGNNTWKLDSCYVHQLPTAGAIAYRLLGNTITLINCNGVDLCDNWGRFGSSIVDGDAVDAYSFPVLIGCNVESYGSIGVDVRNGGLTMLGCSFGTSAPGKLNQRTIRVRPLGNAGFLDRDPTGAPLGAGSTFKNGQPVELAASSNSIVPFATVLGLNLNNIDGFAFWSEPASAVRKMAAPTFVTTDYYNIALREKSLIAMEALGFGVGAGGAVTQATSKATGVTLNKATGAVTMNAAALAATTSVGFVLSNTLIAATDVVLVSIGSVATADSYHTQVDNVAAGTCRISLRNTSAASLSEAVVLNFAVIKGSIT